MPEAAIPFGNNMESSQEELAGASPLSVNTVTDSKGAVMQRPGIGLYSSAPTAAYGAEIDGLYTTVTGLLFAVGGAAPSRPVLLVRPDGFEDLSVNQTAGYLTGTLRPEFAEGEMLLVLTAGGDPQKVTFADLVSSRLGGGPPNGSSVVANASRLLIDNPVISGQIQFSDVFTGSVTFAGAETWIPAIDNSAGFFNAVARPDPVVAVRDNTNEVFVFGSSTLQVFDPDPVVTYAPAATREVGCVAGSSVVKYDQTFAWLDDKRRFVVSDGRTFQPISDQIQQTLNDMTSVSDCFGYRFVEGHCDALVWTFPTDGRTFAYQNGKGWAEWMGWSDTSNTLTQFPVTAQFLRGDQDKNVVAVGPTGFIRELSRDFSSDTTDVTTRILATTTTGFIDHDTNARKQCVAVRLTLRRGLTGNNQQGLLYWRDDLGQWEGGLSFTLGASGDYQPVVEFRSLGVYRTRQWKFVFSGTDPFSLANATEEFNILGN